jgi:hypothetical protein
MKSLLFLFTALLAPVAVLAQDRPPIGFRRTRCSSAVEATG